MKRILIATAIVAAHLVTAAQIAVACEGDRISKLAGVAIDRCQRRDVTLSFDVPGQQDRLFVTIDRKDGKRLYETLRDRYEAK